MKGVATMYQGKEQCALCLLTAGYGLTLTTQWRSTNDCYR